MPRQEFKYKLRSDIKKRLDQIMMDIRADLSTQFKDFENVNKVQGFVYFGKDLTIAVEDDQFGGMAGDEPFGEPGVDWDEWFFPYIQVEFHKHIKERKNAKKK